jgi:hypothetical protein
MWSDNETTTDFLGFQVHADLIRQVITDRKLLPVTIGIFGDWGSGKTSIMHMLKRDLEPETTTDSENRTDYEKIAVLYFNGWLFEGYDDAKAAILTSVLAQLAEHKRFGPKIRHKAAGMIKRVNWMRVAKFGFSEVALPAIAAYATGGISAVPSLIGTIGKWMPGLGSKADSDNKDSAGMGGNDGSAENDKSEPSKLADLVNAQPDENGPTDVRSFREDFEKMLADSEIESLVVLIDDLDRCSPERIIENLEAIKLFLNVAGTAFVIGADPRIVRHAIAVRYSDAIKRTVPETGEPQDKEGNDHLITDYLEKLIHVPYYLPRLSPAEIETYMALLFCMRDLPDEHFQACVGACNTERAKNRYRSFGYGDVKALLGNDAFPPVLERALSFSSTASQLIAEGLKGNPRQVKRFLNAFFLRKKLAEVARLSLIKDDVLIKLMLLEYAAPARFKELFEWQSVEQGHPKVIRAMEEAPVDGNEKNAQTNGADIPTEWKASRLQRWSELEPKLADVDLRDYFWLARDRLASTFSGISLTAPVVRSILDGLLSDGRRKASAISARDLSPDDLNALHELLKQQVKRHPGDKKGYDAFRALLEAGLDSATAFSAALLASPTAQVPPALHSAVVLLQKSRPELSKAFEPVLKRWKESPDTLIGKAVGAAPKAKR